MKKLIANFYPAREEKNGHLGWATITIADAIRLNGISVFRAEDGGININFPGFGDDASYIVPKSKEAYAALRDVVAKAVENEKHFGYTTGEYAPHLEVHGKLVEEPYADGRFSVDVEDICTLYGVTTREVEYAKDGKDRSFISVDLPTIDTYENKAGEMQYRPAFEGRVNVWKNKAGEQQKRDYSQLLSGLVMAERKAMIKERKAALEDQVQDAAARTEHAAGKDAPAKEATR